MHSMWFEKNIEFMQAMIVQENPNKDRRYHIYIYM